MLSLPIQDHTEHNGLDLLLGILAPLMVAYGPARCFALGTRQARRRMGIDRRMAEAAIGLEHPRAVVTQNPDFARALGGASTARHAERLPSS